MNFLITLSEMKFMMFKKAIGSTYVYALNIGENQVEISIEILQRIVYAYQDKFHEMCFTSSF